MQKIIIVEDTEKIRNELKEFLSKYGYDVKVPEDFKNIINYIFEENPDLVLLDINLPVFDGYYICREIRSKSDVPIIIVTSRDSEMDELMSMNLGADDFITKPYNTQILLARISSILRRVNNSTSQLLTHNGLNLNLSSGSISYNNNISELTKNEMKILNYLILNKEKIVSRDELMEYLWSSEAYVDDNTLSVNVTRLRKKLEEIGLKNVIETRRGLGYILI
ncbi:MAG: response regulator transcription factor [Clostridium sp.]|uniref:Stage 0 sporulation protein A homolog n=1 Tax=Clostridium paraputrificum TaxID=29363 RepID=A0A6N3CW10_9CLOT|nr:response regulator transcription factor [Clostridium sp.]MBS5926426.1 response regulator transcription factor [Clostridium sp.]MBS5987540.1 response regulator transcription factor [Clostridium sp.]